MSNYINVQYCQNGLNLMHKLIKMCAVDDIFEFEEADCRYSGKLLQVDIINQVHKMSAF